MKQTIYKPHPITILCKKKKNRIGTFKFGLGRTYEIYVHKILYQR